MELTYDPLSVSFLIRGDDGKTYERRRITTVSRPFPSSSIAAGERHQFAVALPTCDVVSDPCSEHVALKLLLTTKDAARRIPIVTSEAEGSVLQRLLNVRFQFDAVPKADGITPAEAAHIRQIFEARGLDGGFGFTSNSAGFEVSVLLRDRDADSALQGAPRLVRAPVELIFRTR